MSSGTRSAKHEVIVRFVCTKVDTDAKLYPLASVYSLLIHIIYLESQNFPGSHRFPFFARQREDLISHSYAAVSLKADNSVIVDGDRLAQA